MRFRDPVCGMEIRWAEAVDYEVVGPIVVYFCCPGCASRFRQDPEKHVDVRAWMADETVGDATDCGSEPLDLRPEEGSARKSRMLSTTPRIGDLTVDDVEVLIARRWCRLLGRDDDGRLRARTLERALLSYALAGDSGRRHDIDRLLAAEVARLRSGRMDADRIERELTALPGAFADVLLDTSVVPAGTGDLYRAIAQKLAEVRPWVSSHHAAPPAGRARAS